MYASIITTSASAKFGKRVQALITLRVAVTIRFVRLMELQRGATPRARKKISEKRIPVAIPTTPTKASRSATSRIRASKPKRAMSTLGRKIWLARRAKIKVLGISATKPARRLPISTSNASPNNQATIISMQIDSFIHLK